MQRHYFANKDLASQSYGFSSGHVWMWELNYKETLAPENWCFWTMVLEKTLESPLDCKEIQPVNPKENQSWVFIGRTDVEAETPILWPPDVKNWPIWKDHDAGKDWRQEKGMTETEMVGWHHWLNGHDLHKFWEAVKDREAWRAAVHGVAKSHTRLSNWTTTLKTLFKTSNLGTSLAVQGLRFHASTAGAWVSSLVGEIRTHKPQEENKPKTSNLWQIFHSTLYFFWT